MEQTDWDHARVMARAPVGGEKKDEAMRHSWSVNKI